MLNNNDHKNTENSNEKTAADLASSITSDVKELANKGVKEAKEMIKNIDTNQIKNKISDSSSNLKNNAKRIDWTLMIAPIESKLLLGLIIAFILPWISFGPINASGLSIPGAMQDLAQLTRAFGRNNSPFILHYYLLFLIPLFSVVGIWLRYNKKESKAKIFTLIPAGIFMVFFIGALIKIGLDVFNAISFGSLASLFISIAILVITFDLHKKFKKS